MGRYDKNNVGQAAITYLYCISGKYFVHVMSSVYIEGTKTKFSVFYFILIVCQ